MKDHLSCKIDFSWDQRWPQKTGYIVAQRVLYICRWWCAFFAQSVLDSFTWGPQILSHRAQPAIPSSLLNHCPFCNCILWWITDLLPTNDFLWHQGLPSVSFLSTKYLSRYWTYMFILGTLYMCHYAIRISDKVGFSNRPATHCTSPEITKFIIIIVIPLLSSLWIFFHLY